jgi:ADP-heptose:LPS heptosyltransferase
LQNNRKSHLLSYLSFAPLRYGYKNKRFGFLLNRGIPDDQAAMEPVEHQFRLLKPLGIELLDPRPELWPSAQDEQYIKELLSSHWLGEKQKLVGLSVAASSRWFSKCWPPENMAQFCAGLAAREARIVLTGTPADLPRANALAAAVKNTKLINTCGRTTVNQLACLIKRCAVFVSADSSPLHIASAMRVPFVALFGPTDPKRHLPPAGRYAVIKKELLCSPCYKPQCKNNRCMGLITGAEVLEAVEKLLP